MIQCKISYYHRRREPRRYVCVGHPLRYYGNSIALDAVLADIASQGEVDEYWVLGDFSALGYDPVTPLETITALPHARSPSAMRVAMW